jgi:hypothetical protein
MGDMSVASPRVIVPPPATTATAVAPRRPIRLARLRHPARTVLVGLTALVAGLATVAVAPEAQAAGTRPFAATSPFNLTVPGSPTLDPKSASMIARATRTGQLNANLVDYGVPILTAGAATPTYAVACRMEPAWGTCPFRGRAMPIPASAQPSVGSDGALVVLDPVTGTTGEYWQAARSGPGWVASWGAVNALNGSGWGGSSTGAGASRLAGVVRVDEIRAGRIDHALVLQSDTVCASVVRAPALKTDGDSVRTDCLPEGARLQLDPSLNLTTLGLSPAELTVAKAMQVYGAYVIDRGGAPLSVSFEVAPDAAPGYPGAVYVDAGLAWDYHGMDAVPWNRLRVLRTWQG